MLRRRKKENKAKLKRKKNITIAFLVIAFFILFFYVKKMNSPLVFEEGKVFVINAGESVDAIAKNLKKEKIINSAFLFKAYVKFSGQQSFLQAGSYELDSGIKLADLVKIFTAKKFLKEDKKITFIEGWSLRNYAQALEDNSLISSDKFLELTGPNFDYSKEFSFLKDKPKNQGLEGYLFPDTYRFFLDVSEEEIINKFLSNFDKKLNAKMREDIKKQGKTIHEIVTMASIIEKEVRSANDMKIVSGIFWNRIKQGQALESCATLAFILGVNKPQYTYADTQVQSPYNTYLHRDLPPGPIANPGLQALEAAIYPENTNFNYFLTSSETGETIFSRTYEEHLINKNKHLK